MRTVETYHRVDEAHFARACLESAGITVHLQDEHTITTDWSLANAVGGVRLQVDENDYEDACRLLIDLKKLGPPPVPVAEGTPPPHGIGRYVKLFLLILPPAYAVAVLAIDPSRPATYLVGWLIAVPLAVLVAGIFAVKDV